MSDWIYRLNESINYIEKNLKGKIDINEAAKIACCSVFQYERMFSYIAGVTLSEYIRRRRMSCAAFELLNSSIKILDLSMKYGYESPTSFSRAFLKIHNISPSNARKEGADLKAYSKLTFNFSIKGEEEMEYKILEKEEFRIAGFRKSFGKEMESNFMNVPKLWESSIKDGACNKVLELINKKPEGILGVTSYESLDYFNYYIAVATDKPLKSGMYECIIPAGKWVIFQCEKPYKSNIQEIYRRFYAEWLPFSGFKYAEKFDVEVYPIKEEEKAEIWFMVEDNI